MQTVKVRQQGGAMIVTIPRDVAAGLGWAVGTEVAIERSGEKLSFKSTKRQARGSLTVAELLGQIDVEEIATLNEGSKGFAEAKPAGREVW